MDKYYEAQDDEQIYEDVYTIDFDEDGLVNNFTPDICGAPVENPDDYTTYAEPVSERTVPDDQTIPESTTEPGAQTEPAPTTTPDVVEQDVADEPRVGEETAARAILQRLWFMRKRGWLV